MQTMIGAPKRQPKPLGSLDLAALMLLPLVARAATTTGNLFTLYQVQTQDIAILLALPVLLFILQRFAPAWRLPDRAPSVRVVLVASVIIALVLGWGAYALLFDFPISGDERMVVFDMQVYDKGRLAAPLAPQWRPFAGALVPAFLLNAESPTAMVSGYLPVNALLRLAFSKIADPVFYNPALVVFGAVALLDLAKRLFGADNRAIWVTLIVYFTSSQMLVNAMTTYAMTGHMALNLIWLAAFLRGGRWGHAGAIAIGFLATGLHQLVFHLFFVAPFIVWHLRLGRWRLWLLYCAAYCAIAAWWIGFPLIAALQTGASAHPDPSGSRFLDKVIPLLLVRDPLTLSWMMLNMLRFVAWQNLALLPLIVAAVPVARRGGLAAPMLLGIAIWLLFVGFTLPYQGHGWGYRYLHPYLGSFALLAGLGYQQLAAKAPQRTDGMVILLSVLTLVPAMPILMLHARWFAEPQVRLDRFISTKQSDFVVINTDPPRSTSDGRWAISAVDQVGTDPDLTNRPLRFASHALNREMAVALCRRGAVSVVDWPEMHKLGFGLNVIGSERRFDALQNLFRTEGCLKP
ncbi:hypothetical protein GCM10008023_30700 [Sphingomonas glacialis]|uniref:MFS transporter n=1 Tax=Sphingomonas glacialis TaxID=658225 RepID=A0ABQ3LPL2_9SPHN|nr:hypothetical protein [Sphingomonas glacialis]GHH21692.1 hypothetical protein GCM10008023_30700 [Sphingomonas glacialis]